MGIRERLDSAGLHVVILSSIDIGTNTVLLLVARVGDEGVIEPLLYEQRVPRLGRGVDARRRLSPEAMERAIAVLLEYREMMRPFEPAATVVCGTSAVRDAGNREDFARRILQETGFTLEVLSGREEALWAYRGALSGVPGTTTAVVIDIGGGSTEISAGDRHEVSVTRSLDMGSVRLTERFFRHDPPAPDEIARARAAVRGEIAGIGLSLPGDPMFLAVAGTATALAVLAQGMKEFRISAVTNYRLTRPAVDHLFRQLSGIPVDSIRALSTVMEGRADVITAGALILRELLDHFECREILVSERGVRYGLITREWERLRGPG